MQMVKLNRDLVNWIYLRFLIYHWKGDEIHVQSVRGGNKTKKNFHFKVGNFSKICAVCIKNSNPKIHKWKKIRWRSSHMKWLIEWLYFIFSIVTVKPRSADGTLSTIDRWVYNIVYTNKTMSESVCGHALLYTLVLRQWFGSYFFSDGAAHTIQSPRVIDISCMYVMFHFTSSALIAK